MNAKAISNLSLLTVATLIAVSGYAQDKGAEGYAENLYSDFSTYSSGVINFKLKTIYKTHGASIAKQTFAGILGYPTYSLDVDSDATRVLNVSFKEIAPDLDFESTVESFEQFNAMGLPIERVEARLIEVTGTIGNVSKRHNAIELCWSEQDYCHVVDLHMPQVTTEVRNIRRLKADGYRVAIEIPVEDTNYSKATRCRITGTSSSTSVSYSKASYIKTYYKSNGEKAVDIDVGAVNFGVACKLESSGNCDARPYITTAESSNLDRKYAYWWSVKCPVAVSDAVNGAFYPNTGTATAYVRNGCGYSSSATLNLTATFYQKNTGAISTDASLTTNGSAFNSGSRVSQSCEGY